MAAPIANDLVDRVFGKSLDNLDLLEDLFAEVKKEAAFGLGGFGGIGVVLREMEKEEQEAKLRAAGMRLGLVVAGVIKIARWKICQYTFPSPALLRKRRQNQ
eukprot:g10449.t1